MKPLAIYEKGHVITETCDCRTIETLIKKPMCSCKARKRYATNSPKKVRRAKQLGNKLGRTRIKEATKRILKDFLIT